MALLAAYYLQGDELGRLIKRTQTYKGHSRSGFDVKLFT